MRYALSALIFAAGCVVRPDGGDLISGDVLPTVAGFTALDSDGDLASVPWEGDGAFPALDCPDSDEQMLRLEWVRDGYTTRGVWALDRDGIYYGGEQASTGSGTYRIDYHPGQWDSSEPVTLWRFEILPR